MMDADRLPWLVRTWLHIRSAAHRRGDDLLAAVALEEAVKMLPNEG
jgi:hypothetical protein